MALPGGVAVEQAVAVAVRLPAPPLPPVPVGLTLTQLLALGLLLALPPSSPEGEAVVLGVAVLQGLPRAEGLTAPVRLSVDVAWGDREVVAGAEGEGCAVAVAQGLGVRLPGPPARLLGVSVALPVGQALPLLLTLAVPEVLGQAEGLAVERPVPVVLGLSEKLLLILGLPEGLAEELRLALPRALLLPLRLTLPLLELLPQADEEGDTELLPAVTLAVRRLLIVMEVVEEAVSEEVALEYRVAETSVALAVTLEVVHRVWDRVGSAVTLEVAHRVWDRVGVGVAAGWAEAVLQAVPFAEARGDRDQRGERLEMGEVDRLPLVVCVLVGSKKQKHRRRKSMNNVK